MFRFLKVGEQILRGPSKMPKRSTKLSDARRYLNGICRKSLLRQSGDFGENIDLGQLRVLLRLSNLNFAGIKKKLFGDAQRAADRASQNGRRQNGASYRGAMGISF
jgi:hypothetical protein